MNNNDRIINWFKIKGLKCFKISYNKDNVKIHTTEDCKTFEEALEEFTNHLDLLDTGKYNLKVWSEKNKASEDNNNTFSIVHGNQNSSQMIGNSSNDSDRLWRMIEERDRTIERLSDDNMELRMKQMQLDFAKTIAESNNQLVGTFKELAPSLLPMIMEKFGKK